jgi:invasion protein IalB
MPAQASTPQPWTSHEQQPRCGKPLENVHQPQSPIRRNLLHARQSFAANIASGLSLHGFFRNVAAFAKGFAIPPHLLRIKPLRRGHPKPTECKRAGSLQAQVKAVSGTRLRHGAGNTVRMHMDISRTVLSLGLMALVGVAGSQPGFAQADPQKAKPEASNFGPRLQKAQRAQRGPPPEIIATFDDWKIQCETMPVQARKQGEDAAKADSAEAASGKSDSATAAADTTQPQTKRLCGMIQSAHDEKRPQLGLTLYISRIKQGEKVLTQMRILAPIGVWLPQGVGLDIDGQAIGSMPYSNCLPQVCLARAETSADTLDKFKKGTVANFFIYAGPGAGVPLKISLKGFGKALEALDQL